MIEPAVKAMSADWEALVSEYYGRLREAEAEIGRLRTALRVNALRWGYTDAQIDEILYPADKRARTAIAATTTKT